MVQNYDTRVTKKQKVESKSTEIVFIQPINEAEVVVCEIERIFESRKSDKFLRRSAHKNARICHFLFTVGGSNHLLLFHFFLYMSTQLGLYVNVMNTNEDNKDPSSPICSAFLIIVTFTYRSDTIRSQFHRYETLNRCWSISSRFLIATSKVSLLLKLQTPPKNTPNFCKNDPHAHTTFLLPGPPSFLQASQEHWRNLLESDISCKPLAIWCHLAYRKIPSRQRQFSYKIKDVNDGNYVPCGDFEDDGHLFWKCALKKPI
ncbi:hypothetical protein PHYBLDRAFT_171652 [Phycomyces blakesleeanus NRRL 1555(-)]|uniref:Uncharacterized protein n=1 Tax=Phycomyces blakesleeanus (strain ATCC 8743b / DSM 1359 / FGSC 10004 / NBRC 33097 / NRRL 1555) TaxID=763407 RepID=A0A163DBW4_PHYB8|nr:hypothetical protein PHYBLDRAFT_171652 [Phycomyces blakesleeanus NRRL 1555(-)]OAD70270.1 hypothetical protein PHYBLDRAFT_171652 [Phycomyces blakesleeanus NRRL 1555(-)]|eukprot:XP_018288310.1 hypothetical protein PHYBLDRAFT_171652 [Phycomyces blakesleeanus NRRL 1555(-)]